MRRQNPVAKFMNKINKASTHVDKKKQERIEPDFTLEDFEAMKKSFDEADIYDEYKDGWYPDDIR